MRKRLREIAQVLPGRPQLLRIQPEVICITQHPFEQEARLTDIARTGKRFDIPEGAHTKGALLSAEPVWCQIAIDQRIVQQIFLESTQGRKPTLIDRTNDSHERHYQTRCVKLISLLVLHKRFPTGV